MKKMDSSLPLNLPELDILPSEAQEETQKEEKTVGSSKDTWFLFDPPEGNIRNTNNRRHLSLLPRRLHPSSWDSRPCCLLAQ